MSQGVNLAPSRVVLVAIEVYDSGSEWSLNGPGRDLVRTYEWLKSVGITDECITIFASILPENEFLLDNIKTPIRKPTFFDIEEFISNDLVKENGIFWLFWWGHGLTIEASDRRLLCSDMNTDTVRNINILSLLTSIRSKTYIGLKDQLVVIDCCAVDLVSETTAQKLPNHIFAPGQPRRSIEQFVLFSAAEGQYARTDSSGSGLMTGFLLDRLSLLQRMPDANDMHEIMLDVREWLISTIDDQTPCSLWIKGGGQEWEADNIALAHLALTAMYGDGISLPIARTTVLQALDLRSQVVVLSLTAGHLNSDILEQCRKTAHIFGLFASYMLAMEVLILLLRSQPDIEQLGLKNDLDTVVTMLRTLLPPETEFDAMRGHLRSVCIQPSLAIIQSCREALFDVWQNSYPPVRTSHSERIWKSAQRDIKSWAADLEVAKKWVMQHGYAIESMDTIDYQNENWDHPVAQWHRIAGAFQALHARSRHMTSELHKQFSLSQKGYRLIIDALFVRLWLLAPHKQED